MLIVFAPFSHFVWNQTPWRNLQTTVLHRDFFARIFLMINRYSESVMLSIDLSESWFDFPNNFLNFRSDTIMVQDIKTLCGYNSKSYASVVILRSPFWRMRRMQPFVHSSVVFCLYTALRIRRSVLSNFPSYKLYEVFRRCLQLFRFQFFFSQLH